MPETDLKTLVEAILKKADQYAKEAAENYVARAFNQAESKAVSQLIPYCRLS